MARPPNPKEAVPPLPMRPAGRRTAVLARVAGGGALVGAAAAAYTVYDIARPNHFVGDMYGLEVLVRLLGLGACLVVMTGGAAMLLVARLRSSGGLRIAGSVLALVPALALVLLAAGVARSRQADERRKGYPALSVAELVRIATGEKDPFAVDALAAKQEPAARAALVRILLDENERGNLRVCAAQALGQIGGPGARQALEAARAQRPEPYLADAVRYALETLDAAEGSDARGGTGRGGDPPAPARED